MEKPSWFREQKTNAKRMVGIRKMMMLEHEKHSPEWPERNPFPFFTEILRV